MSETQSFTLHLEQGEGFEFRIKFDWPGVPELLADEPEPLGKSRGPNAARLLAAAVANCLSASLVFCLRNKFRQNPGPLRAQVTGRLERNDRGRYRVAGIDVDITLAETAEALQHIERCAEQFEDFCVVTESVRRGIPVSVSVKDADGRTVHQSSTTESAATS